MYILYEGTPFENQDSLLKSPTQYFFYLVWAPKEAHELHLRTIEWETKV